MNNIFSKKIFNKKQVEKVVSEHSKKPVTILVAHNKEELKLLVREAIKCNGNECDLNFIDVSAIEDMSCVFFHSDFNGDVSKWNVARVKNMTCMFSCSAFVGDLSNWKVDRGCRIDDIFFRCNIPGKNIPKSMRI